jgi:peptidoglycan/xylan/chitin deacetylase (PgdA/CDA1 family)
MIDRRTFLVGAASLVIAACSDDGSAQPSSTSSAPAATATTRAPATGVTSAPTTRVAPSTRAPGAPSFFVSSATTTRKEVALTFHTDGDLRIDQRLLDGLAGRAQVTCFIVGSWLEANPTWARKLLDAGHELANHTYSHPTFTSLSRAAMATEINSYIHPTFTSLSRAAMATEITRCRDLLVKLTGSGGRFFRPSGTDDGLAVPSAPILQEAATAGYDYVLGWDVEPFDYQDPGGPAVRQRVLDGVKPGSIVSMHFGHSGTADVISGILDGLDKQGLKAVTTSALLGLT